MAAATMAVWRSGQRSSCGRHAAGAAQTGRWVDGQVHRWMDRRVGDLPMEGEVDDLEKQAKIRS